MQTAQRTTQTTSQEVVYVPFHQLCESDANVRKTPPTDIEGLARNIKAEGLLQNLIVSPTTQGKRKGKYAVAGGRRRWLALSLLVRQKDLPEDTPIPCKVISQDEAVTASLAENEQREPMCPADRFDAYKKLIDSGKNMEYVATVFGVTPLTVQRYLKLTNISPKLFALFRQDQITLEQMQALSLADNQETQEQVWLCADAWQRQPHELKKRLTEKEADAQRHPLARFVGLQAYQAAGGAVRRDLFSSSDTGYMVDMAVLHRLAEEKLAAMVAQVRAEGWAWVEILPTGDISPLYKFTHLPTTTRDLTPEEEQQMAALQAERKNLEEQVEALADDEQAQLEVLREQWRAVIAKQEAIESAQEQYDAEEMKQGGVILQVKPSGKLGIHRGLVRPVEKKVTQASHADAGTMTELKEKPVHSEKLVRRLLAHRTAALQVELAAQPDIALAVIISRLAYSIFHPCHSAHAVHMEAQTFEHTLLRQADDLESSPAWKALEALRKTWEEKLPTSEEEGWHWLLAQPQATQLDLLAVCVAFTVNGVQAQEGANPMDWLAEAVGLNMTKWWKPTRASYFDHVTKARIQQVLEKALPKEAVANIHGMKKNAAAETAERRLAETPWLPNMLRDSRPA